MAKKNFWKNTFVVETSVSWIEMRHSFRPETEQTLAGANVMDLLNFKMPFQGAHELGLIFVKVLLRWFYKFFSRLRA